MSYLFYFLPHTNKIELKYPLMYRNPDVNSRKNTLQKKNKKSQLTLRKRTKKKYANKNHEHLKWAYLKLKV